MTKNDIKEILQNMGFIIFEDEDQDIDISEYIMDSIQFIDFIVRIEEYIGMELPDDFLQYDILVSANGLANKITYYYNQQSFE